MTLMKAEVRPMKTAAEQALAKSFAAAKPTLSGGTEIAERREGAFRNFEALGLPHRRVEAWKYTDLRALMREAKPIAGAPNAVARQSAEAAGKALSGAGARRLVFVDGTFVAELSDTSGLEPGLKITSLAEALTQGGPKVLERIGRASPAANDAAFALNTAFMHDGAVIEVEAGARIARPIHLVFFYGAVEAAAVVARSLVTVDKGASLTLIESHEGPDSVEYQSNVALDLSIGDDACLDHVKLTSEGERALHISTLTAEVGENARYRDFTMTLGGAVARNQLFVRCAGVGATIDLRGASLLKGKQHADTTLSLDHAVGGCQSRELFKSVLEDESRTVFQGKIIVRPDAQKTDARMMTRALLLSEMAEADSKPELEIFADDVQCGHGCTTGALDDELKFYLMARGIPAKEAEALLIQSFIGEALDVIELEPLKAALSDATTAWLLARG
ncbi:MAG: Fe-S cluster assembly protein SufD [Hyphomicrobium sp.]|jgi:Fe-S cluster assembly protein SufD